MATKKITVDMTVKEATAVVTALTSLISGTNPLHDRHEIEAMRRVRDRIYNTGK